jgi:hypothetical protein
LGELAKAAFDHGFEWYGVDILKRYYDLCYYDEKELSVVLPRRNTYEQRKNDQPDVTAKGYMGFKCDVLCFDGWFSWS